MTRLCKGAAWGVWVESSGATVGSGTRLGTVCTLTTTLDRFTIFLRFSNVNKSL